MGESTGISWTDHTANFWMGCQRVSPGCERCYAEKLVTGRMSLPVWGPPSTTQRQRTKGAWKDVVRWNRQAKRDGVRRRVFVSSLSDVFEAHPMVEPWRVEALDLLAQCDGLDVQLLTKRPENVRGMVPRAWLQSWPAHVWMGTTVEDQHRAEQRIPHLLKVPADVRFLSMEPLLESVGLDRMRCDDCGRSEVQLRADHEWSEGNGNGWCNGCDTELSAGHWLDPCADDRQSGISWVIVGGESGPGARPFDLEWARSIVRECDAEGVSVFVKQMGDAPVDGARVDVLNMTGGVAYVRPASDPDGLLAEALAQGRKMRPHALRLTAHHGADPLEWPEELQRQNFPHCAP